MFRETGQQVSRDSESDTTPGAVHNNPSFPWSLVNDYVAVRSRFFDDFYAAAVYGDAAASGGTVGIRQAVILAAGLDTRTFRLEWPDGMTVYEVDAPLVLSFKEKVLAGGGAQARSARHVVATDLREDWSGVLCGAGFDPARPAAWLAEGLMMYLPDEAKASLLPAVQALSAPGSRVAIEHITSSGADVESNAAFREAARRTDFDVDVDTLWSYEHDYDPVGWLRASGWSVDVSPMTTTAERYGRPLAPTLPAGMLTALLVIARKS